MLTSRNWILALYGKKERKSFVEWVTCLLRSSVIREICIFFLPMLMTLLTPMLLMSSACPAPTRPPPPPPPPLLLLLSDTSENVDHPRADDTHADVKWCAMRQDLFDRFQTISRRPRTRKDNTNPTPFDSSTHNNEDNTLCRRLRFSS